MTISFAGKKGGFRVKISAIRRDLKKKLRSTIDEIADKSVVIMEEELENFYNGGVPLFYVRTGTLGTTPRVTDKYCSSNEAGVRASLNQDISYDTGTFSGAEVIDAAEHEKHGIVGRGGFWERSEERINETVDETIEKNF